MDEVLNKLAEAKTVDDVKSVLSECGAELVMGKDEPTSEEDKAPAEMEIEVSSKPKSFDDKLSESFDKAMKEKPDA